MKKAIVIGASSGIGRELSKILARSQYVVGVMARRVALLDELRRELGRDVLVEPIDLADAESARHTLSRFIEELGGVDLNDLTSFDACLSGPDVNYPPGHPCLVHDTDTDLDVDLADWAGFQAAFTGP
jgi:NAD(P)-dependent dehydrogenase (short-subunit alcohol dehydrogenase family)